MGEAILYQLHSLLAATALGFCRLAPTFYLLPFFASGNIPTVVRHPIIIVVSCALVQHYHYELLNLNEIDIALFAAREIIIGLFIACLLASPFWIFLAIGSFIDNQRGATLSSTLDPATGVDTSELARFNGELDKLSHSPINLSVSGIKAIPASSDEIKGNISPSNTHPDQLPLSSAIGNHLALNSGINNATSSPFSFQF
ncbi:hypothetical protein ESCOCK385B3_10600 [Escherichia coli]